jgi:pimeloyl-ACP methyl ester carboxylesterase
MGSASGYIKTWEATIGHRFDSPIPKYVPISIIFGDTDNTLPKKDCQERSLAPNHSNWIILEKSGHAPMWDNSEAVSNILQEDIRKSSH